MSKKQHRISMIIGVVEFIDHIIAESKGSLSIEINTVVLKNARGNLVSALKTDGITGIQGGSKVNDHA